MVESKIYDLSLVRKSKILELENIRLKNELFYARNRFGKYCADCGYDLSPKRTLWKLFFPLSYIFFVSWFILSIL